MDLFASVHPKLPVCHSERSEESTPNRKTKRFFVASLLRMTFQIVISGCGLAHKIKFTLPFQCICCLFLLVSLVSCGKPELKKNSPDEVLLAPGFRLLDSPQEIVPWRYYYLNRVFSSPSYRTPQGTTLPGWRFRVIAAAFLRTRVRESITE
jgi:hypothetical protein